MSVGSRRLSRAGAESYGKRLLMALGVASPWLAWNLWGTIPYYCYEALIWDDPIFLCGLLFPEVPLAAAGLIVLVAFVAPTAYRLTRPRLASVRAWWNKGDD